MSDFQLSIGQRRRLLAGDRTPLEFKTLPTGCKAGAVYVLAWKRASATAYPDGFVSTTPQLPVWFLTVKTVKRWRKGVELVWTVKFDVTDLRDPDLFLRRGGGYQTTVHGAADVLPIFADEATTERARQVWREQALLRKEQLDRDRRRRSQAQRLAEAKRQARLKGVDVSTDERVIEDRISRMERKVDRDSNGNEEAA